MIIMDDSRPLLSEPTQRLPECLTERQERPGSEAVAFPSLGVLPAGTEIAGRYKVESELSVSGGEADVFCCLDKETGQKVAVKVYRGKLSPKEDLIDILVNIKHENLIALLAFNKWNNRFIEVMEFAEGAALTESMPYTEGFLTKIIIPQVVEGMNCLHNNNIIHRDLKPANLFFKDVDKSKVVIADYGISSLLKAWEGSLHHSSSYKGTLDFSAPETFSGIFGKETDFYSLGISLLVLMTGESPLAGMSDQEKMHYHLAGHINLPEGSSERFTGLIEGLLCKNRKYRWGYNEVRDWLRGKKVPVPGFEPYNKTDFVYTLAKIQAKSIEELGELMLKNPEEAKKHIRKRLIYDAIKTIDQSMASAIDDIQSEATTIEEAMVGIIFTFNPELPYTFIEDAEIKTPAELARLIDKNRENWSAGKMQLFNGMIPAWLSAIGYDKMVIEWRKVADKFLPDQSTADDNQPTSDLHDAGLETFLHLLYSGLDLPWAMIEPQSLRLRFDKGKQEEIQLRIFNRGRGYLSGTIELAEQLTGLELSAHRFGLDSKNHESEREMNVALRINTNELESGREYSTSLTITTNGKPEMFVVPLSIQATDRTKRSIEVSWYVSKFGLWLAPIYWLVLIDQIYWLGLIDQINMFFGHESPMMVLGNLITAFDYQAFEYFGVFFFAFLGLIAGICILPAKLISGRTPGWLSGLLFIGALVLIAQTLGMAESTEEIQQNWILGTVIVIAVLPLFVSIGVARFLYYQSPHLSSVLAIAIMLAAHGLTWSGIQAYGNNLWLTQESADYHPPLAAVEVPAVIIEEKQPELILHSQDDRGATFMLLGAERKEVYIFFTDRCWVRITQDGVQITEKIFYPDEEVFLEDAIETRIRLGYPEGAFVIVNGFLVNDKLFQMNAPLNLTIIKQN